VKLNWRRHTALLHTQKHRREIEALSMVFALMVCTSRRRRNPTGTDNGEYGVHKSAAAWRRHVGYSRCGNFGGSLVL